MDFARWTEEYCEREGVSLTEFQMRVVDVISRYDTVAVYHSRSGGMRFVFDLFTRFARESLE